LRKQYFPSYRIRKVKRRRRRRRNRRRRRSLIEEEEEEEEKKLDRGNGNFQGLTVKKAKREGRQDRRKPAVPSTNLNCLA
jgi:hypothetical protein